MYRRHSDISVYKEFLAERDKNLTRPSVSCAARLAEKNSAHLIDRDSLVIFVVSPILCEMNKAWLFAEIHGQPSAGHARPIRRFPGKSRCQLPAKCNIRRE